MHLHNILGKVLWHRINTQQIRRALLLLRTSLMGKMVEKEDMKFMLSHGYN